MFIIHHNLFTGLFNDIKLLLFNINKAFHDLVVLVYIIFKCEPNKRILKTLFNFQINIKKGLHCKSDYLFSSLNLNDKNDLFDPLKTSFNNINDNNRINNK